MRRTNSEINNHLAGNVARVGIMEGKPAYNGTYKSVANKIVFRLEVGIVEESVSYHQTAIKAPSKWKNCVNFNEIMMWIILVYQS